MGAKASTGNHRNSFPANGGARGSAGLSAEGGLAFGHRSIHADRSVFDGNSSTPRERARSLGHVQNGYGQQRNIDGRFSPDSDSSPDDASNHLFFQPHSLPAHLLSPSLLSGLKCPVCSKFVPPDDIECHLVICLTKPRISYNEDVLTSESGECVICLDNLEQGDTIARLPCLCIYHKSCIDSWFEVNRSCPEHPND